MLSPITPQTIFQDLTQVRQQNPLIHNVTNLVAMQTIANSLLALGAAPIMAHAPEELMDIVQIANALALNIGTLDKTWVGSIQQAQQLARKKLIPIVLDPVGAGASRYRTQIAHELLAAGVDILRGNASEIIALTNTDAITKGVDSTDSSETALQAAMSLGKRYGCVVVISGATDWIVAPNHCYSIHNGTALFTKVTAMGCTATAIIAAFAAINRDYTLAAAHAMAVFTIAGQHVSANVNAPGSFFSYLIDQLYSLNERDLLLLKTD